ncbi:MAG: MaoC family dehydratase N-terminal domain-containing protein [Bacteriovoracia bacterium]
MSTENERVSKIYSDRLDPVIVDDFAKLLGSRRTGYVPPTFLTRGREGEFELLNQLGIALSSVLHGEQTYEIFTPPTIGGEIRYQTRLKSRFEKRGSQSVMIFLVFETEFSADSGAGVTKVATSLTTMIVRSKP